jgi:FtsZ-binding cell division protein ZapB
MSDQPVALGRGLFGYKRSAVKQAISDRDVMLRQIEVRVLAAEANAARLEAEMADLRHSNSTLERQVQDLTPEEPAPVDVDEAEVTSRFLTEELAAVLAAAQESAGLIMERARVTSQRQIAQADRLTWSAKSQLSQLSAWRDKVEPALSSAQTKIDEVRTRIEEIPDQIREALSPLAEAVAALDGRLAEVSEAATPPPSLTREGQDYFAIGEGGTLVEGIEIIASANHGSRDPGASKADGKAPTGADAEVSAER